MTTPSNEATTPEATEAPRRPGHNPPADEPIRPFRAPEGAEDTGRYAAYDTLQGRYVGGVHTSKDKASKAARDAGVDRANVTVVEV